MTDFNDTARRLVAQGYSVIPIIPGEKRPGEFYNGQWHGMTGWQTFCHRHPTQSDLDIWSKWPSPSICVALGRASNITAIDYDYGSEELRAELIALLPPSPCRKVGAKGFTDFYRAYRHVSKKYTLDNVSVCELLAHGKQTVLPPSVHPDGMSYQWLTEQTLENTPASELPEIPIGYHDQVAAIIAKYQPQTDKPLVNGGSFPSTRKHGSDQSHPYWRDINDFALQNLAAWVPILIPDAKKAAGGGYRASPFWRNVTKKTDKVGINPKGIMDFGLDKGMSPLDLVMAATGGDLEAAVRWVKKTLNMNADDEAFVMPKSSHNDKPLKIDPPILSATVEPLKIAQPIVSVAGFPIAKGAVGKLVSFINKTAIRPQPVLALGAALCAVGVLAGRKYACPSNLRTNIYIASLAGSGAGKNHARTVIDHIFSNLIGCVNYIGGSKIASGSGLLTALHRNPSLLFQQDEFGAFLMAATNKEKSPRYLTEIVDHMTELFTSANSVYRGIEYADQSERPKKEINEPCLCVHGTTVPGHFWKALQSSNALDGSLARFLIFEAGDKYPYPQHNPQEEPPDDLTDLLKRIVAHVGTGNLSHLKCGEFKPESLVRVPYTKEANDYIKELYISNTDYLNSIFNSPFTSFWSRQVEHIIKVATIHAIGCDPETPVIGMDDVLFSRAIVDKSIKLMVDGVERFVSDNAAEGFTKRVIEIFRKAGGEMSRSELYRKTHFLGRDRDNILKSLVEAETLKVTIVETGRRPKAMYALEVNE